MICNNNYLADIIRVCEIKDLIWVMRFQSPLVYFISFDHLKNKFDFLSVHGILNISGLLQSTLTLQETKVFSIP